MNKIPMMLADDLVRRKGTYFVVRPSKIGLDIVVSGHYKEDTATSKAADMDNVVVWEQVGDWEEGQDSFSIEFKRVK